MRNKKGGLRSGVNNHQLKTNRNTKNYNYLRSPLTIKEVVFQSYPVLFSFIPGVTGITLTLK